MLKSVFRQPKEDGILNVGLALEGGGMRGIFTTGILDVFLENNIRFDQVIGVSAGSCHACSYLSAQQGRGFRVCADYINDKNYCGLYSLIKTGDIFGVEMIYHTIPEKLDPIDDEAFKNGNFTFQAVITNCRTGQPEYPYIKSLFDDVEYIRASSSLPGLSRMVEINGEQYLDGGIADSIPLRRLTQQGTDKNVVILTQPRDYIKPPNRMVPFLKYKYRKYPELLKAMTNRHNMYNDSREFIFEQEKEGKAFVFAPEAALNIAKVEKNRDKLLSAYNKGRQEAEKRLDELKKFMCL